MDKTYYCLTHPDRISAITCSSCGKRLCTSCAKFSFGKKFCGDCFDIERAKYDRTYSDPLCYFEKNIEKKDYNALLRSHVINLVLISLLAGIFLFRNQLNTFFAAFLSGSPAEQTEQSKPSTIKEFTGKIAGMLVSMQMNDLSGRIELNYLETGKYPLDFPAYLRESFLSANGKKDPAKDIWGTEYMLEPNEAGFCIRSAGMDREFGTNDDVVLRYIRKGH